MKKVLKGINFVIAFCLILLAAAVIYIALPIFGNQALIVRSGSMEPTIDVGSVVVVRAVEHNQISPIASNPQYNKGDVIAFRTEKNSKTLVTHRITGVETGPDGVF